MKGFGFWVLMLMSLAAALVCFGFYVEGNITSPDTGLIQEHDGSYATLTLKGRKLKEEVYTTNGRRDGRDHHHHDELDDYRPIDPVPSSKASIRPGPIQHGTPLMPYIPKPSPPPDGGYPEQPGFP